MDGMSLELLMHYKFRKFTQRKLSEEPKLQNQIDGASEIASIQHKGSATTYKSFLSEAGHGTNYTKRYLLHYLPNSRLHPKFLLGSHSAEKNIL